MVQDQNAQLMKAERQTRIRELVERQGRVVVPELSLLFGVSEATVRRDLEEMDGLWVRRTHGGAVHLERAAKEPPMMQRVNEQAEEKRRIGQAVAGMIQEGETIFFSSGTTVLEVARALPQDIHITVITNSLAVINELVSRPHIEIIVLGGMFRQTELSMVGHITEQALREFRAHRVIFGVRAIDPKQGLTNDYLPETLTDRIILTIAPQVIVVADHTKFGRVSSVLVAPTSTASLIVTDTQTPDDMVAELRELGIKVLQV